MQPTRTLSLRERALFARADERLDRYLALEDAWRDLLAEILDEHDPPPPRRELDGTLEMVVGDVDGITLRVRHSSAEPPKLEVQKTGTAWLKIESLAILARIIDLKLTDLEAPEEAPRSVGETVK